VGLQARANNFDTTCEHDTKLQDLDLAKTGLGHKRLPIYDPFNFCFLRVTTKNPKPKGVSMII
jgi:hypothetical protein